MRCISIFALFILCTSCLSDVTAIIYPNNENDPVFERDLQPAIPNENVKPKTKFNDLNADVLFHICEHLDLMDLLNLVKARPIILSTAQRAFRRNFNRIGILMSETDNRKCVKKTMNDEDVDIPDLHLALEVIEYFGHMINELYLGYIFIPEWELKNRCINDRDYSILHRKFTSLKILRIFAEENSWKKPNQIEELIRKNSQIRTLQMTGYFPREYIIEINKLLPTLTTLISDYFKINEMVEFERVRHFQVRDASLPSLDKLSFPNLESVEMRFFWNTKDEWTEFFKRHQNVSRLLAHHGFTLPFMEFTAALPKLVEFSVENTSIRDINEIAQFIETRPMLMKFQFFGIIHSVDVSYFRGIQERFESDWRYQACGNGFSLERKI